MYSEVRNRDDRSLAGNWDDARSWYKAVLNVDPNECEAYCQLGELDWLESARGFGTNIWTNSPHTSPLPDPTVRASLRARWWTTLDDGIRVLNQALACNPRDTRAMSQLANIIRERADLRDTKEESQRDIAEADQWTQRAAAVRQAPTAAAAAPSAPPSAMSTRIHVGDGVQSSKLLRQPRPVYPPEAKKARIQGVVKLSVTIDKEGRVTELSVISGDPALIPAAVEAVKQWIYQPTMLNGEPVEVRTQIDINFNLSQ